MKLQVSTIHTANSEAICRRGKKTQKQSKTPCSCHVYFLVNMKSLLHKHDINKNVLDKACPDSKSQHKLSNTERLRVTGIWENTISWHKTLIESRAKNRGSLVGTVVESCRGTGNEAGAKRSPPCKGKLKTKEALGAKERF